jgi:hypothetical protein
MWKSFGVAALFICVLALLRRNEATVAVLE